MPTLILPTRYTPDSVTLWRAALAVGWSAERLQSWVPPERLRGQECVVYGEPLFAATIVEALGLALLEPPLDWLTTLPSAYLTRQVRFTTLGEARTITERTFIKPADDKCFPAKVYESGAELAAVSAELPESLPVLVSEAVQWEVEYRSFVLHGQVATLSPYLRDGELVQTEEGDWPAPLAERQQAWEYASHLLQNPAIQLPPAVVLDVGRIAGADWAVIEANPTCSAGIYGCNPSLVLAVLQRACVRKGVLTTDDFRWVIKR